MNMRFALLLCLTILLAGCGAGGGSVTSSGSDSTGQAQQVNLLARTATNTLAYIPPQCFTKTQDAEGGTTHNPCYACHAASSEPNYNNQESLQLAYSLPQAGAGSAIVNPWTNLFKDRSAAIAAISDDAVSQYVAQDNYLDSGGIALVKQLASLPVSWDVDADGKWGGYTPDAWFNFDARGYDRAADGRATGWRAFSYYPFPGAFMPTNGAFDDVLIRLPAAFRNNAAGVDDLDIYTINLAVVEALIKRGDIAIAATDEAALGVDLDNDGKLGTATVVRYHWNPVAGDNMSYVGQARAELAKGKLHLAAGLFPEGTEFLHSVRYLAVAADDSVVPATRMKELRYARKAYWRSYSDLNLQAQMEAFDKRTHPDTPEIYGGDAEHGLNNNKGWTYQGFIEDKDGKLRPQSYEETLFCMGCHSTLSATEDGAFAFPRKLVGGSANGWTHWSSGSHAVLPDPKRKGDAKLEYSTYLRNNRAGDEFRGNTEVLAKFFNADGSEKADQFAALASDVSALLLPAASRARTMSKAYWALVKEQSFAFGRDGLAGPASNVWQQVEQGRATGVVTPETAPRLALP
jgi:hypothetical protein